MRNINNKQWSKLLCDKKDLHLIGTLTGGQSFRWIYNKETDDYTGVFSKTVWKIRQKDDQLQYTVLGSLLNKQVFELQKDNSIFDKMLIDYFRLDTNLEDYYTEWSEKDEFFKTCSVKFCGIRMLDQEPVENLFSFICSQNNHISRITTLVEKLCTLYGEKICVEGDKTYYAFPEVEKLMSPQVEANLRQHAFGYRAKFIQKSAAQIVEWGGQKWFEELKAMKYKDCRAELMKLHGIGPKVADCICLMSLNHLESLPVDTHVYQIAAQNYLPHLRGKKNVTESMYTEIGDHFRTLYGDKAGWAHTILFCADLKKFQDNDNKESNTKSEPKSKRKKVK